MTGEDDIARLRREYARRERSESVRGRYSLFSTAGLFIRQQRQRALVALLRRQGIRDLSGLSILEIGCGDGGVLLEFVELGARPEHCGGVDVLSERIDRARRLLPSAGLVVADAQSLPQESARADIVLQFTAFSSILDDGVRAKMAGEMLRVMAPGGLIVWYDFWLNPTNRQTRGVRLREIRGLFPGCRYDVRRVTLAPPLARAIAPLSWTAACLVEACGCFNSHLLVGIRRGTER